MEELEIGDIIKERYSLLTFLGSGSFGEVWLARDIITNREVALKIYLSLDPTGVDEFQREYSNTLDISSPFLLTPEYFDIHNRRPFLVMKYCEKGASSKLCGKMSEHLLWKYIEEVANGLNVLHTLSDPIIHQDIKPDNILIDGNNRFLITDFGISKRLRATMRRFSKRDVSSGAMPYMAPERFESCPKLNTASDIWSLGASIYELAMGELPFSGFGGAMQRNGAEMPDVSSKYSDSLNLLMQRCLSPNPSDRPAANELAIWARDKNNINTSPTPTKKEKSNSKNKIIIYFLLAIIILSCMSYLIWKSFNGPKSNTASEVMSTFPIINEMDSLNEDISVENDSLKNPVQNKNEETFKEQNVVPKPSKITNPNNLPLNPSTCPYVFINGNDRNSMTNNKSINVSIYGRDYTFTIGDNHPNGVRAIVIANGFGDNLFNYIDFTTDDEEIFFDEFDDLKDDCNLQLTAMDFDNDDECELLLSIQSEGYVTLKTYVFKLLPNPYKDSIVKYLGFATGQSQMYVEGKSLIAPYGSQGLFDEYILAPNNKIININN